MKFLCALLGVSIALAAEPDARDLMRRALLRDQDNRNKTLEYTFRKRSEKRDFDSQGKLKKKEILTHDVMVIEGTPYDRLVERGDKPLPPDEERKEQQRLRDETERRKKETAAQRTARLSGRDKENAREAGAFREFVDAFSFQHAGTEKLATGDAYVIDATPVAGYKARTRFTSWLPKMKGRAWIDKATTRLVRGEAEFIEVASFGYFLARLSKGSRILFEQMRVDDDIWMPRRLHIKASARIALVIPYNLEQEITYSNYRKFQIDSPPR